METGNIMIEITRDGNFCLLFFSGEIRRAISFTTVKREMKVINNHLKKLLMYSVSPQKVCLGASSSLLKTGSEWSNSDSVLTGNLACCLQTHEHILLLKLLPFQTILLFSYC